MGKEGSRAKESIDILSGRGRVVYMTIGGINNMEELKRQIAEHKAQFSPEQLTDEDREVLGMDKREKAVELTSVEVLDTLREGLKDYVRNARDINEQRDREVEYIKENYSDKVIKEKVAEVQAKHNEEKKKYSKTIRNYLDKSVEYLERKLEGVEEQREIPQSALTEIELLEKLDNIEQEEMQRIVDRYKNSSVVVKVLSQIGKKHNLYFEKKDINTIINLPKELQENVNAILNAEDFDNLTYTQRCFLVDQGNWIDLTNERIDNYINGTVVVNKGYGN